MTAATDGRRPGGATIDTVAQSGDANVDVVAQLAELIACTSWRLRRASRSELEPLGLTFGQARALRLLARAGEPLRIGELAARLEVVPRSATAMVDGLETAGLARRHADPLDRRRCSSASRRPATSCSRVSAAPAGPARRRCSPASTTGNARNFSGCSPRWSSADRRRPAQAAPHDGSRRFYGAALAAP